MKTIVLGIGNPILRDDGAGIHVAHQLKHYVTDQKVTIDEAYTGGMNLLDMMIGYDKAILIDTVNIADAKNGEVKRLTLHNSGNTCHSYNPHDISLQEALRLAEKLGEKNIPKEIIVIGIVVKELSIQFGEQLSENIQAAVPKAVEMTLHELKKIKLRRKKVLT
ncbi:MAG TPA: hydrogenase maturation protease [Candidatus Thermoplasmatota archaeon]|nr:hydrogenase maturation protease [Candidatus Thermoplasmatota archaeon]